MKVKGELEEASLEIITTADEASVRKETGMIYYNKETKDILIADTSGVLQKIKAGAAALGDVKASVLTEAQFTSEVGSGWTLADGKDVTGSDYHTLTGVSVVPDLRGKFLRGKNHSRADGGADPYGDKALGSEHGYKTGVGGLSIAPHSHTYDQYNSFNSTDSGVQSYLAPTVTGTKTTSTTATPVTSTDLETAPTHTVVNYFIKINR